MRRMRTGGKKPKKKNDNNQGHNELSTLVSQVPLVVPIILTINIVAGGGTANISGFLLIAKLRLQKTAFLRNEDLLRCPIAFFRISSRDLTVQNLS